MVRDYYKEEVQPVVEELLQTCKKPRVWLCPRLLTSGRIEVHPILKGIECTKTTVPELIKGRRVVRHFTENSMDCIIWENAGLELEDKKAWGTEDDQ